MKAGLTKSLYIAAMRLGSLKMLLQTQQWHRAQSVIYRLLTAYHQQANGLYEGYYQMLSNTRLKFAQKIVGLGMRSFKTLCIAIKMLCMSHQNIIMPFEAMFVKLKNILSNYDQEEKSI